MRFNCRTTDEIVHSYSEYLKTTHWKQIRDMVYAKAKGRCRNCKCELSGAFVAHHDSTGAYRRIGRERIGHWFFPDDVIAVCKNCHNNRYHALLHWNIKVPEWAEINSSSIDC